MLVWEPVAVSELLAPGHHSHPGRSCHARVSVWGCWLGLGQVQKRFRIQHTDTHACTWSLTCAHTYTRVPSACKAPPALTWPFLHHLGVLTQRRPARGASLAFFPHTLCVPCFPLPPCSLAHLPTLPCLCIICPHPHGEPTGQCSPALRAGPSRLLGLSDLVAGINQSVRCAQGHMLQHMLTRAHVTHTHTRTHTHVVDIHLYCCSSPETAFVFPVWQGPPCHSRSQREGG